MVLSANGSVTGTPFCSIGAINIMMISSTSMTSTSGVTLMSDFGPPFAPPTSIAMGVTPLLNARSSSAGRTAGRRRSVQRTTETARRQHVGDRLRSLLDEVIDELG